MYIEAWMISLIPLIGSFIAFGVSKKKRKYAGYFSLGISITCLFLSLKILYDVNISRLILPYQSSFCLFYGFGMNILEFGILIDEFNLLMIIILGVISTTIFIYSLEYMNKEINVGRYWFWMNFFIGSMFLLLLSNNFIEILLAWLMLSLCNWGLISFWYKKTSPSPVPEFETEGKFNKYCGTKALITIFFACGFMEVAIILIEFATIKSFSHPISNFLTLSENDAWVTELSNAGLLSLFSITIILSVLGLSGQFPFHDWLFDSTNGPITASALINSVTTVSAGVYIFGRFFLINYGLYSSLATSELSLSFKIAIVCGLITIIFTGAYGLVANDLKKILASSTSGQLGYTFFIYGIAGIYFNYAIFILGTLYVLAHSIFKSLLFLYTGSIRHLSDIKNTNIKSSLKRIIKKYYFLIVICAFLFIGLSPLVGYFSTQLIVRKKFDFPTSIIVFLIASFLLTNINIFRMIGLIFFGTESDIVKTKETVGKTRESNFLINFTLILLTILCLGLSLFYSIMIDFLLGNVSFDISFGRLFNCLSKTILSIGTYISMILIIAGFLITYPFYFSKKVSPDTITSKYLVRDLYKLLKERIIFDSLYYSFFRWINNLGNAMKDFHILLDKCYYKIPQKIKHLGNAMKDFHILLDKCYLELANNSRRLGSEVRKFHTGKINLNLIYFIIFLLLSLSIIFVILEVVQNI